MVRSAYVMTLTYCILCCLAFFAIWVADGDRLFAGLSLAFLATATVAFVERQWDKWLLRKGYLS